jgi:hypothetical protein
MAEDSNGTEQDCNSIRGAGLPDSMNPIYRSRRPLSPGLL